MPTRRKGAARKAAPASRSGTPWTDADRRAHGYGRITLRLPEETLRRLQEMTDSDGIGRAEWIRGAIDEQYEQWLRVRR